MTTKNTKQSTDKNEKTTMKKIAYIATDNGIEGREPTKIMYAAWTEEERDRMVEADKAKAWRRKTEIIVDVEGKEKGALAKLDGVERLVLGLPAWPEEQLKAQDRGAK